VERNVVEHLRLLSELACEFSAAVDDDRTLLALVARRLGEALDALCIVRLISADGRYLEFADANYHADREMISLAQDATARSPQRVGEGVSGRVAASAGLVFLPVVDPAQLLADQLPERQSSVERLQVTSLIVAPLVARNRVIGVVSVSRHGTNPPFAEADVQIVRDVTAHAALAIANARSYANERASHQALYESEIAHRLLFEASPQPMFVFDVQTLAPLAVNEEALRLFGYSHEEFMQVTVTELAVAGHDTARARLQSWGDAEASGTSRYRRRDGTALVGDYTTRALFFQGRRARITVVRDVTDRHDAEQARALLAAIVDSSNDAIVSKGLDGVITSWNAAAERLFGYAAREAIGRHISIVIPRDRLSEETLFIERIARGERVEHYETVRLHKNGTEIVVSLSIAPILDGSGHVIGASKTARDLTAQHRSEQALRRTEEQLRQAQKMEAVGRLAGGVAHDFNNILSVILSYSSFLAEDLKPSDPMRGDIDEIRKAALRAEGLTRQLLMFSRQQVIAPKVLDINELLAGMNKMLTRILGEDVDLALVPESSLGQIRADPGSVEQAIMNLVVNARDAMPVGGKLTIETRNVELDEDYARAHIGSRPGPHVMLAVSDTGVGMDDATQARIFEPFFTTKEPGKGTGLGLSTVFGIVQQCGGSVWVYSEPGDGTTFKLYFPRVEAAVDVADVAHAPATLRGTETILLVEDQEQVRAVALGILKRNGYRVIVAQNAGEALLFCEKERGAIHLLLTDVVMPQMSGAELAKRLASVRPETKVLCMSGYTDDSIVRHGVLESGIAFLQKPFTPESLARKVREVLDAPRLPAPNG
jgi:two-component system, cell cycle sensor histidine kinase and response regulator CckA